MPSTKSDVHPYYGFTLPRAIAMLARLPDDKRTDRYVEAGLGCGRDPWLAQVGNKSPAARANAGELGYVRWPFEVVPFAWQGGDGLTYAMLVHAPELSGSCPLVAHAPNDDPGCTWLGDDANEGLANLAAVALRKPDEYDGRGDDVPEYRKEVDLAVAKITAKLGLKRVKDPKELKRNDGMTEWVGVYQE